ncbi:hypothetical protein [Micromonospora sp. WMMD975]|uniref:hypothetical protein n=1 Tax=Micromonospora sp. WMMD975 TaxID=3016087 RepID=UPI00249CA6D8|nr:hypothetical protein [Micromonospora sp. WMMD975]WFE33114.1 hypothetical protein O7613_26835 [Micromonospora sp. WMMD975]
MPELSVDEIRLAVDGLDADLSLRARLANLLQIDAGVRVHLEGVELDIAGVRAEALLKVRLEKLVQILDRALATIDRNPELIDALARSAGAVVDDVHRTAGQVAAPVVDRTGRRVVGAGELVDRPLAAAAGDTEPRPPSRTARGEPSEGGRKQSAEAGGDAEPGGDSGSGDSAGLGGEAGPGAGAASGGTVQPPGAGAAQLAGQAGQTLRQAGRSVWEAIQSGMAQHRQQRPGR